MSDAILQFLSEMTSEILTVLGLAYIPLVTLIIFRAGRLRGLNEENMAERLGDLCFDTLKEEINDKLQELLHNNNLNLPPGLTIQDLAAHLHKDSENLNQLLTILRNLAEAGVQSAEFQQILNFISPF